MDRDSELAEERLPVLWLGFLLTHWKRLVALVVLIGLVAVCAPASDASAQGENLPVLPRIEGGAASGSPRGVSGAVSALLAAPWQPADECRRIRNPGPVYLTRATLGWCAKVAYYLDLGERRGLWVWRDGDLHRLLLIIECESNGEANPGGQNPRGSLFQHNGRYWSERAGSAARQLGFDNPIRHWQYPYDSIAVGVWLFKTGQVGNVRGGPGHWSNCSGLDGSNPTGRVVQQTLRNMGLTPPTARWNG